MSCNTTNQGFKYHAFLSCAGEDRIHVKEFYHKLTQYGARIFYYDSMEDGSYGQNPNEYLYDMLRNSQHFIFYWTSNTNKEWINREIEYFDAYCKNGQNRVIIVYHDIVGKADFTQLNKSLRDDYYREVNFAELLKRIGADSGAYMERRYSRLMEFLNKPEKQLGVAMKVGAGCCIWSAPVIREIMEYGGINGADVTFFEKDDIVEIAEEEPPGRNAGIKSEARPGAPAASSRQYRYEVKRMPYFYSRSWLDKKKRFLTIPPYIKACELTKEDLSTVLNEKLEDWRANFNMLPMSIVGKGKDDKSPDRLYDDVAQLLREGYDKLTIYELSGLVDPAKSANKQNKQLLLFVENTVEGGFATLTNCFELQKLFPKYVEREIMRFIKTTGAIEKEQKEQIKAELRGYENTEQFLQKKIVGLVKIVDDFNNDRSDGGSQGQSVPAKDESHKTAPVLDTSVPEAEPLVAPDRYARLIRALKTDYPILFSVFGNFNADNEKIKLQQIVEWRCMLEKLCELLKFDSQVKQGVKRGFFNDKDLSGPDLHDIFDEALTRRSNPKEKVRVKLYHDPEKNKKLFVIDREVEEAAKIQGAEAEKGGNETNFHSYFGYASQETLNWVKGRYKDRVEFAYYDEISNTKLYTAKDIVGMVHDNELDCVIVPAEVHGQEHEKGRNQDVLTKIASIMYTVEGGCDFRFITRNEQVSQKLDKLIKENASNLRDDKTDKNEEHNRDGRKVLSILNKLYQASKKKELELKEEPEEDLNLEGAFRSNRIKILYTPNTVARKYHEKYLSDPRVMVSNKLDIKIVHDPVDFGDWNELKKRIVTSLGNEEVRGSDDVLLVLGWQPQMGWIDKYFNKQRGYYVKEINLLDFHGVEDLPYLSYDIMLRTNVVNTWFRSYAFESFLRAIKGSIVKLNESMQNVLDQENEVMKIAKFLNMDKEECRKYLKVINFEFRYDAKYFKLYEQHLEEMNTDR